MLNLTSKDSPDFELYESEIGAEGTFVFVDVNKYYQHLNELEPLRDTAMIEVSEMLGIMSDSYYQKPTPSRLQNTLLEFGGIESADMMVYNSRVKGKTLSTDAQKVIAPLVRKLEAKDEKGRLTYPESMSLKLLKSYQIYSSLKSAVNNATAKIDLFRPVAKLDYGGKVLHAVDFKYVRAETSRYYTREDNLQGWNKRFLDSLTVPRDYVLWWGDMSQIDLRVALNCILKSQILGPDMQKEDLEIALKKQDEFQKIMNAYDDKYEAFARIVHRELGRDFDVEKFKQDRPKYKVGVLARMYGTGMQTLTDSLNGDVEFAQMLNDYFLQHEQYQALIERMEVLLSMKCNVAVQDYFGVERVVEVAGANTNQLLDQLLNTPVQSTSNSIVVLWVLSILKRFRDMGFGKDLIRVYMVRHDESVFMIHKSLLPYVWIFEDYSKIAVDDWSELTTHSGMGTYYGVEDPDVMALYKEVCDKHREEFTPRTVYEARPDTYSPVSDVLEVFTYSCDNPIEVCTKLGLPGFEEVDIKHLTNLRLTDPQRYEDLKQAAIRGIVEQATADIAISGFIKETCKNYKKFYGKCVFRARSSNVWHCCSSIQEACDWAEKHGISVLIFRNRSKSGYNYTQQNQLIQYKVMDEVALMGYVKTFFDDNGAKRDNPDYSSGALRDPMSLEERMKSERARRAKTGGWMFGSKRQQGLDIEADDIGLGKSGAR